MRIPALLAVALGLAAAVPAMAQDRPAALRPTRDVMVEYHVSGVTAAQHRSDTVDMYFTDHGMKLRVEPVGQPGYAILDRNAGRMFLVTAAQHIYMEVPYDATRVMAFDDTNATFTRRGTDTVAGIACTVYDAKRPDRSGQVCLSDDGVLLRAHSNNPAQASGELLATKVSYGPQPANLFVPPSDFQKMDIPGRPPGAPGQR